MSEDRNIRPSESDVRASTRATVCKHDRVNMLKVKPTVRLLQHRNNKSWSYPERDVGWLAVEADAHNGQLVFQERPVPWQRN